MPDVVPDGPSLLCFNRAPIAKKCFFVVFMTMLLLWVCPCWVGQSSPYLLHWMRGVCPIQHEMRFCRICHDTFQCFDLCFLSLHFLAPSLCGHRASGLPLIAILVLTHDSSCWELPLLGPLPTTSDLSLTCFSRILNHFRFSAFLTVRSRLRAP